MSLIVENAGLVALPQDVGRPGLASHGIGPSGAFDQTTLRMNHAILGNPPEAAVLEIIGEFSARATRQHIVAVTGAPGAVHVDGQPVGHGQAAVVAPGQCVAVAHPTLGLRRYLGVAGGFDFEPVLGSQSSDTLGQLGPPGVEQGQRLRVGAAFGTPRAQEALALLPAGELTVNVMLGPREDWFTRAGLALFFETPWQVSSRSDRIGVRLDGPEIERANTGELASEPCVRGSIQVTSAGLPVVLGPDHPVTGGYPVIGVAHPRDVDKLAHVRAGDRVRFRRS